MKKQKSDIQIFLAYAREDEPTVLELYEKLKQEGYKPWIAKSDLRLGQEWKMEIFKAIHNSDIFIACLSSISVKKQGYVQKELEIALDKMSEIPSRNIYIIPLKLDECEVPDLRIPNGHSLRHLHWCEYWRADGWGQLCSAINTYLDEVTINTDDKSPQTPKSSPTKPIREEELPTTPKTEQTSEPERLILYKTLIRIMPEQLDMIIFTLSPPPGIIPPFPASTGQRVDALLNWATAPGGCGLNKVQQTLTKVLSSS